jgi:hypothetical protein
LREAVTVSSGEANEALVESLLTVRESLLPSHDIGWIEAAGSAPRVELVARLHLLKLPSEGEIERGRHR